MPYESLEKIFHKDRSNERFERNQQLAQERLLAESTFRTGFSTESGELFLAVPRELSLLNETVLRREREISLLLTDLPRIAQSALIRSLVIDEVVCTNDLEGVRSTRRQINALLESNFEGVSSGALEKKRFRELARLYLELSDQSHTIPSSAQDVRTIYDQIMQGEDLGQDAPDGVFFRSKGVDVIGNGGKVLHSGLMPESAIITAVETMLDLASDPKIPEVLSALTSHYLFEYIHPFYDGNGRTGRYLLALYLSRPLSTFTALSLSRTIAENRAPYYRAFRDAEHPLNHGELTPFVMQMMQYVLSAQERLVSDLSAKRTRLDSVGKALDGLNVQADLAPNESNLLYLLAQYGLFGAFPEVSLDQMAHFLDLSKQMTRKYARLLEDRGLIRAVSSRPLQFVLSDSGHATLGL